MLASLATRRFRNLDHAVFEPVGGSNLLLGGNGAGKTSLLEAAYVAATTRSFRSSSLADCVRHGESSFHVAAAAGENGHRRLELGWEKNRRYRAVDGQPLSLREHLAVQPVVAWTSTELDLLVGGPDLGRRFLDRGLVASRPGTIALLARFRRTLEQKRELLAAGQAGGFDSWNELLAAVVAELAAARAAFVTSLESALVEAAAATSGAVPVIRLEYRPSPRRALDGAEAVVEALESVAVRERQRRRPLIGSHRDRLVFLWRDREVKRVASAGERKGFGLLLASAQARIIRAGGREPLVLLDDADTELDGQRLAALWGALDGVGQLLVTSNRGAVWKGLPLGAIWAVEEGRTALADDRLLTV